MGKKDKKEKKKGGKDKGDKAEKKIALLIDEADLTGELGDVVIDMAGAISTDGQFCKIKVRKLSNGRLFWLWRNPPLCGLFPAGKYIENCVASDDTTTIDGDACQRMLAGVMTEIPPPPHPHPPAVKVARLLRQALLASVQDLEAANSVVGYKFII